jgi:hypothetical protein
MEQFPNFQRMPDATEGGMESKEKREFTVEEIGNLLKQIDGKERPDLLIVERKENIKGELMFICFTNNEKETIEGEEHDVTYLLTVAGQRYNNDGTPGRVISNTFLTKDYDNGMFSSELLADHINGEWTNLPSESGI